MESWFLADPETPAEYYGREFNKNALKANPKVQEISKSDVLNCLKEATRKTTKGPYHKTQHAPHILEKIGPERVRKAAPECDRLFQEVLARL